MSRGRRAQRSGAVLAIGLLVTLTCAAIPPAPPNGRLALKLDTGEADAALAILDAENSGTAVDAAAWQRLHTSPGYVRLHEREAAIGAAFTDQDFAAFLAKPETRAKAPALRQTLEAWKAVSPEAAAARAFAYLPRDARIKATVYAVIKPRSNSFVFDVDKNPAIFLYVNPEVTAAKFENTMAHELHHIGYGTACPPPGTDEAWKHSPQPLQELHKYLGAFGEGFAMLAAAGGPEIHPHAVSPDDQRSRWDRDIARFADDFAEQDRFFTAIARGEIVDVAKIDAKMDSYFGEQGPWYTVGWKMAVTIEETFGRERLISAECRSDTFPATYNAAAEIKNRTATVKLPLWSRELLAVLVAPPQH
jgi:hypothetical protein